MLMCCSVLLNIPSRSCDFCADLKLMLFYMLTITDINMNIRLFKQCTADLQVKSGWSELIFIWKIKIASHKITSVYFVTKISSARYQCCFNGSRLYRIKHIKPVWNSLSTDLIWIKTAFSHTFRQLWLESKNLHRLELFTALSQKMKHIISLQ